MNGAIPDCCLSVRKDQRSFARHIVFEHSQDLPCGEAKELLDTLDLLEAKLRAPRAGAGSGGEMKWG